MRSWTDPNPGRRMTERDRSSLEEGTSRLDGLLSGVRFGQFASVGVVGAIVDNSVLTVLRLGFDVVPELAKAAGIESAIVVMFLLNDRWTFAAEGNSDRDSILRRFLTSNLVRVGGIAVQLAVFSLLIRRTDFSIVVAGEDIWFLAASLIAIGVAMFVNYVSESLFTWRVHRE